MTDEELRELDALTEDWRGTSGEVQLGDAVRRLVAEVRRLNVLTQDILLQTANVAKLVKAP